ncbi:hypothetical protein JCM17092_25250 [Haloplanus litoreus]
MDVHIDSFRADDKNGAVDVTPTRQILFGCGRATFTRMGFGSYDESEQENQELDADLDDNEGVETSENDHRGSVEFEIGASNDELIDRLKEIKDE